MASIATAKSNPELSANLGWASLGLGIAGSATGAYSKPKTGAPQMMSKKTPKFGAEEYGVTNVYTREGSQYAIVRPPNVPNSDTIYIIGHAGRIEYFPGNEALIGRQNQNLDTYFTTNRQVTYHTPEGSALRFDTAGFVYGLNGPPTYRDVIPSGTRLRDYGIISPRFRRENGTFFTPLEAVESVDYGLRFLSRRNYHIAMVATDNPIRLSIMLNSLSAEYTNIYLLTCRS
ncbi:hypothetical protein HMPREF9716_03354 [Myroides odoratus CIP 103059]|nr:hypothetical protein HMPREF9716_03354 [Myroides odoratus CIP 103059]